MSNTFTEPSWESIRNAATEPTSRFALLPPSPFEITGIFIRLLQFHFGSADRILSPNLKGYVWTDSPSTSAIQIAPDYSSDIRQESKKPGLFVQRGEIGIAPVPTLAGANISVWSQVTGAPTEITTSNQRFKFLQGTHAVLCEGMTGTEAELLAEEVFLRFLYFSPIFESDFHFHSLDFKGMTQVQKRENTTIPTYVAGVSFGWTVHYGWSIATEDVV